MVAILLTGMSGAGKSTALAELARLGFETVDTDDAAWTEVVDGEPLWRIPAIERLLDTERSRPLFVLGTVANQGVIRRRFGAVVLLTAPVEVLLERLRTRGPDRYGGSAEDREKVARDTAAFEPRLRAAATHVVDTTQPVGTVVASLVAIADEVAVGRR